MNTQDTTHNTKDAQDLVFEAAKRVGERRKAERREAERRLAERRAGRELTRMSRESAGLEG